MENIGIINKIAEDRQKAKEITNRVQKKRENGDGRTFADVLQEELNNIKRGEKDA